MRFLNPVQSTAPSTKERMDWPDIAKGLSIIGVVLLHASYRIPESDSSLLNLVNQIMVPIRMPLFFMVSGFFAYKILNKSFKQLFKERIWYLLVPLLIWTPVEVFVTAAVTYKKTGNGEFEFAHSAFTTLLGEHGYWFLQGLIIFNLILWISRRLPGWAIYSITFCPLLLMPIFSDSLFAARIAMYLPTFMIGAYYRQIITQFSTIAIRLKIIFISITIYSLALGIILLSKLLYDMEFSDGRFETFSELAYYPLRGTAAILSLPAAIMLSVLLSKIKPISLILKFLGRHTLVIYLGHYFGFALFELLVKYTFMSIDNESWNPINWSSTWIVICTFFGMAGGLFLHVIATIPIFRWTIFPPRINTQTQDLENAGKVRQSGNSPFYDRANPQ